MKTSRQKETGNELLRSVAFAAIAVLVLCAPACSKKAGVAQNDANGKSIPVDLAGQSQDVASAQSAEGSKAYELRSRSLSGQPGANHSSLWTGPLGARRAEQMSGQSVATQSMMAEFLAEEKKADEASRQSARGIASIAGAKNSLQPGPGNESAAGAGSANTVGVGATHGANAVGAGITTAAIPSGGSLNGTSANGASAPADAGKVNPAVEQPKPMPVCLTITYHHKKLVSHPDNEACSHHKNVIKLKHAKIFPNSLCVRVNGTPVRYQVNKKASEEILVGPIAGPEAVITARYCSAKPTCNEECRIPKDEFMDAIGGGGGDEKLQNAQITQWDADDSAPEDSKATAKMNADLKKELSEIDETEPGTSEGLSMFREWVGDPETPACNTQQATSPAQLNKS